MPRGAVKNCVIYSDVSVTLPAVILPDKRFNIFKASFSERLCVLHRLSSPPPQHPYSYHSPSFLSPPLSNTRAAIPYLFVFVLFFAPFLQHVAVTVRPCQYQVVLKNWQRQLHLDSLAVNPSWEVKLDLKYPKLPQPWREGWKSGTLAMLQKLGVIWRASLCT